MYQCPDVTSTSGPRVGIYCRISQDTQGDGLGVARQEADCRALCERRGWDVGAVYIDNSVSAYGSKVRPEYRRLLDDLNAGAITGVVVYDTDRLTRQPRELEEFLDVCDAAGVRHLATCTGDIDLSTDDGRLHARILGAFNRKESDAKKRRVLRKHEELANDGKVGGGGTRPFGWEPDLLTIRESEAIHIRDWARLVLVGDSLRSLVVEAERTGVPTVTGARWSVQVMRRLLTAPRNAGLREHRGEIVGRAVWPPILDEVTARRVRGLLTDPDRRTFDGRTARRYLLTGFIYCGLCGGRIVARPMSGRVPSYTCPSGPPMHGCGKIRRHGIHLEAYITEAVLARAADPAITAARTQAQLADAGDDLAERIAAVERQLNELGEDLADGKIGRIELHAASTKLRNRLTRLRHELEQRDRDDVAAMLTSAADLAATWDTMHLDRRRALIDALIERITLTPCVRGLNRFDPTRVQITWRT